MLASLLQTEVQSAASSSLRLFGDYSLANPGYLLLFLLLPFFYLWGRGRAGRLRGRVSVLPTQALRSLRQRWLWLPGVLHALALGLVIVSLARPLRGSSFDEVTSEGVDIALVIDRSGSMEFSDLAPGRTRLSVVKEVVGEFAERRMGDREGVADNCALISFAHYPELLCPFTLDAEAFKSFLNGVTLATTRAENRTGIGVALAKAVSVLRESAAKSKVVILLTDGENNVEDILPLDAAELAAENDIKVFTIYSAKYLFVADPFRGGYVASDQGFDTTELEQMAELTGGLFFHADDEQSLRAIYAEIESLERTERNETRYEENYDLYLWFLLTAIGLYAGAWFSGSTWARRLA